ncbi:phosphatidylethanolamine-binding protein [Rhodoferax koreense]|uniref:Phosphatidylethanolamine-binding protein n=1 Tax=Rhodoferax koreensis TaxID=1842727 RepID=A0A1P8JQ24_9BURK|nr:YbhB/YbcL family Raf kinase inhibitor-like protein [Rhodoferax koreense]APW35867.1 phosphatidylethanolamine-binding protein [Rhodoferax koreense]
MLEKLPEAVGHLLRDQRAGLDAVVFNRVDLRNGTGALVLQSLSFQDHAPMPALFTADGEGISPPLHWSGVPEEAASLVLVVEDADAPTPQPLVHAIVVDMPASLANLPEGALKSPDHDGTGFHTGRNSYLMQAWLPPDPPPGHGVHRYVFQLFALRAGPDFEETPGRDAVVEVLRERAVASGMLIGTYTRPDGSIKADEEAVDEAPVNPVGSARLA